MSSTDESFGQIATRGTDYNEFFNINFVVSVLSNTLMFTIAFTISFYTYLVVFDRKKEDK